MIISKKHVRLFPAFFAAYFSTNAIACTPDYSDWCSAGSPYCETQTLALGDTLPETAVTASTFRSGTTPHNNTCSEKQIYQSQNVSATNSEMTLNFIPNVSPAISYNCTGTSPTAYTQTSGAVYTQHAVTMNANNQIILHGAVEVNATMPQIIRGIWPAIWMLPSNTAFTDADGGQSNYWPQSGEIDTIEMAGYEGPNGYFNPPATYPTTIHFGATAGDDIPRGYVTVNKPLGNVLPLTGQHTFTMEWQIILKSSATNTTPTTINPSDVAMLKLSMYLDGKLYASDKKLFDTYWPIPCDNGLVGTGTSDGTTCGAPVFYVPAANPNGPNDSTALTALMNGFNSGFRLIMNVASGGPIFYNDTTAQQGAQSAVSMHIFSAKVVTIHDMVFAPNALHGAKLSWVTPTIPDESVSSYTITITSTTGPAVNYAVTVPAGQNELTIPSHTFYGNQNYSAKVLAAMTKNSDGTAATTVLLGNSITTIRP